MEPLENAIFKNALVLMRLRIGQFKKALHLTGPCTLEFFWVKWDIQANLTDLDRNELYSFRTHRFYTIDGKIKMIVTVEKSKLRRASLGKYRLFDAVPRETITKLFRK